MPNTDESQVAQSDAPVLLNQPAVASTLIRARLQEPMLAPEDPSGGDEFEALRGRWSRSSGSAAWESWPEASFTSSTIRSHRSSIMPSLDFVIPIRPIASGP